MMTLSLTATLGMLALAVDLGWAFYRQQAAQTAADAAAAAAVRAAVTSASANAPTCNTAGVYCGSARNCPATAPSSPSTSFDNACMLASANGFTTSGIDTVSVQAGTSSPVPTVSGPAPVYWAVVRVNESLPALFSSVFGGGGLGPGATATAGATGSPGAGSCIYVLDPSAQDAFEAANGASVQVGCGVYVDSNNATAAMYVTGGASVTATSINVAGAFKKDNGGTTSVVPTTGAVSVADPFATLPAPTPAPSCQPGNFTAWQASPYTPAPNTTYCGFSLGNGMSLEMSPGIYIVDGGTFSIQGGSTVTASGGVLIYLTNGATVNVANGSTVTLSAETSGPYQGVLFYQDRSMAAPGASTFAGGATMNLTGSLYFPHATLDVNNGSGSSVMAIVADMVNFQGGAHLQADAGGTKTGLSAGYRVTMIQ